MAVNKIDYQKLPVYEQKQRILDTIKVNQVIVVQSPTGSGKTTQIPVILYEAGYADTGVIAVTQPRRIAALSVSEFISKQLGTSYPGLVGYKMRFEDKTDFSTRIKIMTDGILLQELKLDPWLSKYSVIMVDEAHERSLNIDFVLGLLKRILAVRKDFKVIISSATINADVFSAYFGGCPIVTIETQTFPVTMVYDPPLVPVSTVTEAASDAMLAKIENIIERVLENGDDGSVLIFLPGEKAIKDCMNRLDYSPYSRQIYIVPLYGRLPKDEQERVFDEPPPGKKKIIISTNIAETSVTISDVTTVIDTGLAKLNFYNPHTFTSSLEETAVSKASCDQRRGRAGRTQAGTCYRLYPRRDYEARQMYTTEEIYRTDLSEVVLRMAELGITQFFEFDFISPPERDGIEGAVDTLRMLGALEKDNTLSSVGKLMVLFPLEPRVSRIIVEAIMRYPSVMEEALVAAAFLSANSPFVLPPGQEMEARRAHHRFNEVQGDFVSYLTIFKEYCKTNNKERFCHRNFLDERVMAEIKNIDVQLSQIMTDANIPLGGGGSMSDYLCCVACGMIQFVCIREGRENYRSLTADHICIHPGSNMFRQDPLYIVAGEIVRTSRMFAMSVSPLTKKLLNQIQAGMEEKLDGKRGKKQKDSLDMWRGDRSEAAPRGENSRSEAASRSDHAAHSENSRGENTVAIGRAVFPVEKIKGRRCAKIPYEKFLPAIQGLDLSATDVPENLKGKIFYKNGYTLFDGEKLPLIIKFARTFGMEAVERAEADGENVSAVEGGAGDRLSALIDKTLRVTPLRKKGKEYGFVTLYTDCYGNYWCKVSKSLMTAVNETLSSLETLTDDENVRFSEKQAEKINALYRKINSLYTRN